MVQSGDDARADAAANSAPKVRTVIGSQVFLLDTSGAELEVFTKTWDRLDSTSAEVIVALGGDEPRWLRIVEALSAVHRIYSHDQQALLDAAAAIGQKKSAMIATARESQNYAELVALAEMGIYQVATNPLVDHLIWGSLMDDRDRQVRARALSTANVLPPALAEYPDPETRLRVARNPLCPARFLEDLALDADVSVQVAAAGNANLPTGPQLFLGMHADMRVRQAIASNPSAPRPALDLLLKDHFANVRSVAVTNPALTSRLAAQRIWIDPTPAVHIALSSRVDLSPRSLSWIERYARRDKPQNYTLVRRRLRQHAACPKGLELRLDKIERRLESRPKPRTPKNKNIRPDVVFFFPLALGALIGGCAMAGVGLDALSNSTWVKGWVLLLIGVLLGLTGIWAFQRLYARRPNWNGTYWAPLRRGEITRFIGVLPLLVLLIAGSQSRSNDQQNAPWEFYVFTLIIVGIIALKWFGAGVRKIGRRTASR
jgi:hypothetical protein